MSDSRQAPLHANLREHRAFDADSEEIYGKSGFLCLTDQVNPGFVRENRFGAKGLALCNELRPAGVSSPLCGTCALRRIGAFQGLCNFVRVDELDLANFPEAPRQEPLKGRLARAVRPGEEK